jgi:hypothetical protein
LRVETGIAETQQERAEDGEFFAAGDDGVVWGLLQGGVVRQIQENEEEADDVEYESGDHYWVAPPLDGLGSQDAESGASYHLSDPDEDTRQAHQLFAAVELLSGADASAVDPTEEAQFDACNEKSASFAPGLDHVPV